MKKLRAPATIELPLLCTCGQKHAHEFVGLTLKAVTCAACGLELLPKGATILEAEDPKACSICRGVIRAGLPHLFVGGQVLHTSCLKTAVVPVLKDGQRRSTSRVKRAPRTVSGGLPGLGKR